MPDATTSDPTIPTDKLPPVPANAKAQAGVITVEFQGKGDTHVGGLSWGPAFPGNMTRTLPNSDLGRAEAKRYEGITLGNVGLAGRNHPDHTKPAFVVTYPK